MKNPKKPTYDQKRRISKAGIDPTTVLVKSDNGTSMILINKITADVIEITK